MIKKFRKALFGADKKAKLKLSKKEHEEFQRGHFSDEAIS